MSFFCKKCGECCRHIDKIPQLAAFDIGNGICCYLKDNLCSIYDNRPEICRIDYMYDKYYVKQISREEYYAMNEKACRKLFALTSFTE